VTNSQNWTGAHGVPLPPPPTRDLPPGRHHVLKEQLMTQIAENPIGQDQIAQDRNRPAQAPAAGRRPSWIRPAFALPVTAVVAVAAVVTGVTLGGHRGGQAGSVDPQAAVLLERVAQVASTQPALDPRADQFIFTEKKVTDQGPPPRTTSGPAPGGPRGTFVRRDWTSPDGGKHWVSELREGQKADEFDVVNGTGGATTYNAVKGLPADPDALLRKFRHDAEGKGDGPDQEAFVLIGDLVMEGYPLPKLNAALFRAAARIPGVAVLNAAVDPAGRPGIGIARTGSSGGRTEWLFSKDYTYLGEREVSRGGKETYLTVHLRTAVVDELKQLP
jgi:hypothetical protein